MTKEDIIRMANYVGIKGPASARQGFKMYANPVRLKRFAALVAAHEREAIMKICNRHTEPIAGVIHHAIRARGTHDTD